MGVSKWPIAKGTNNLPRVKTHERSQGAGCATGNTSTRGREVDGKTIVARTWFLEVERRMRFLVIENRMTRHALSVYMLWASSRQLHPFMLGVDVARRALLGILTPPF